MQAPAFGIISKCEALRVVRRTLCLKDRTRLQARNTAPALSQAESNRKGRNNKGESI